MGQIPRSIQYVFLNQLYPKRCKYCHLCFIQHLFTVSMYCDKLLLKNCGFTAFLNVSVFCKTKQSFRWCKVTGPHTFTRHSATPTTHACPSVGQWNGLFLRQRLTLVVWVCDNEYDGDSKCHQQNSSSVHHHTFAHKLRVMIASAQHTIQTPLENSSV